MFHATVLRLFTIAVHERCCYGIMVEVLQLKSIFQNVGGTDRLADLLASVSRTVSVRGGFAGLSKSLGRSFRDGMEFALDFGLHGTNELACTNYMTSWSDGESNGPFFAFFFGSMLLSLWQSCKQSRNHNKQPDVELIHTRPPMPNPMGPSSPSSSAGRRCRWGNPANNHTCNHKQPDVELIHTRPSPMAIPMGPSSPSSLGRCRRRLPNPE